MGGKGCGQKQEPDHCIVPQFWKKKTNNQVELVILSITYVYIYNPGAKELEAGGSWV